MEEIELKEKTVIEVGKPTYKLFRIYIQERSMDDHTSINSWMLTMNDYSGSLTGESIKPVLKKALLENFSGTEGIKHRTYQKRVYRYNRKHKHWENSEFDLIKKGVWKTGPNQTTFRRLAKELGRTPKAVALISYKLAKTNPSIEVK